LNKRSGTKKSLKRSDDKKKVDREPKKTRGGFFKKSGEGKKLDAQGRSGELLGSKKKTTTPKEARKRVPVKGRPKGGGRSHYIRNP